MFGTLETSDPALSPPGFTFVTAKSPSLGQRVDATVYTPMAAQGGDIVPIVVLLHGVYGSHWAWAFKAGVHRRLEALVEARLAPPMVLCMPSDGLWGDGSGYVAHRSQDFEAWIAEEAAQLAIAVSPACSPSSPLFLCGLSMGGYAALRMAGKYPHRFAGVSAHSAITADVQFDAIIAESRAGWSDAAQDRGVLAALIASAGPSPFRFDCGVDDPLLPANRELHLALEARGLAHRFEIYPGGHNWAYWSKAVELSLCFFGELAASPREG